MEIVENCTRSLIRLLAAGLLAGSSIIANAQSGYEVLESPLRTGNTEKIEVIEFFWYGCPHCFRFEPQLEAWKKTLPDNVEFINAAPPLNAAWKIHSQAFYAAQVTGIADQFHEPMFNAIHIDKKPMRKPKDIVKLVESLGLDSEKFQKAMKSFNVDAKIRQSMQMAINAGVNSVPTVIVNGKYRTSGSIAGSYENLIKVLNDLVEQESAQ